MTVISLSLLLNCWIFSVSAVRPLVVWHGLGDQYDSVQLARACEVIQKVHPDIFIHKVYLSEKPDEDQKKSFFGDAFAEIADVAQQLAEVSELSGGFDAIGFSQGGLFLRSYVELFNDPPVKNLVTYGSPHNGIADLPPCRSNDFFCERFNRILKSQVWSDYAQNHLIPAQYFRNVEDLDPYFEHSRFLIDVNNEIPEKRNATYASNLRDLSRLVMVMFTEDETVIPKESAWFQEHNLTSGVVVPLERRDLYIEDWIGLRKLGESGRIDYLQIEGVHMEISDSHLIQVAEEYLGSPDDDERIAFVVQSDYRA